MRDIVLVADASDASRSKLREALVGNFVVLSASTEAEAIKLISENSNKLCAVVVDYLLQGGVSVLKFMGATGQVGKFPVVFISSFNLEDDDMKEFAEEIDDIIERPLNTDIIKRRIFNLVELYNFRRSRNF